MKPASSSGGGGRKKKTVTAAAAAAAVAAAVATAAAAATSNPAAASQNTSSSCQPATLGLWACWWASQPVGLWGCESNCWAILALLECNCTQEALVDELLLQQGREKISFWRRQRLPEGENLHTARPAESLRQCSFPYDLPILAMNFQVPKGAPFGIPENSWESLRILEDPSQESWESWEFW